MNFQFIPKDTLLFGRESAGVPKMVHENSHARLKIPLTKKSRSLNISIAAAIILSEALKQNMFFQNVGGFAPIKFYQTSVFLGL